MKSQTKEKAIGKKRGAPSKVKVEEVDLSINGITLDQIEKLAQFGLTDAQISQVLKISEASLNNYKKQFPEFYEVLKRGKIVADLEVYKSLFKSACGYEYTERKVKYEPAPSVIRNPNYNPKKKGSKEFIPNPDKKPILVEVNETVKHVQPNPTSIIFWSINRMKLRRGDLHKDNSGALQSEEVEQLRLLATQKMESNI